MFISAVKTVVSEGSVLNLNNVSINEAGVYTCFVSNDAGIELLPATVYLQPEITKEPEDITASLNQSVSFNCTAEGFPSFSIAWQRLMNDEFVMLNEENRTVLEINSIQYDNAGVYRCLAYSIINGTIYSATANATLTGNPFSFIRAIKSFIFINTFYIVFLQFPQLGE